MEIRQLRYFLDIAETEHLTQSAQNLFVTQSTLSHGLRQLEQELDVALFDRLGRGLKLSQAGAEFRVYARRALQEIEAGRMALADLGGLQSGSSRSAPSDLPQHVVPATVAAFSRAYPKVKVQVRDLRAGPIEQQLLEGELDLGIAFHPAQHEEIEAEVLFEERLLLVVGPRHPLARPDRLEMAALSGCRWRCCRALCDPAPDRRRPAPGRRGTAAAGRAGFGRVAAGVCRYGDLASIVPERGAPGPDLVAIPLCEPRSCATPASCGGAALAQRGGARVRGAAARDAAGVSDGRGGWMLINNPTGQPP